MAQVPGGGAPFQAAPSRGARLVIFTGASSFPLARIHDEYAITCLEGDAFELSRSDWYALYLEVDGKREPFAKAEHVTMRITDDRDPDVGARQLFTSTSTTPYKDGMHYFRAVTWRQVGEYRLTFRVTNSRRVDALMGAAHGGHAAAPRWLQLARSVIVTDATYETDLASLMKDAVEQLLEAEAAAQERAAGYSLAPLNKRELAWIEEQRALQPALSAGRTDPPASELARLAGAMAQALRTPGVKDACVLVPLFESDAARRHRVALAAAHKGALRRQRVSSLQRLLQTSAGAGGGVVRGGGSIGTLGAAASAAAAAGGLDARALIGAYLREQQVQHSGDATSGGLGDMMRLGAAALPSGGRAAAEEAAGSSSGSGGGARLSAHECAELAGLRLLVDPELASSASAGGGRGELDVLGASSSSSSSSSSAAGGVSAAGASAPDDAPLYAATAGTSRRCRHKRGELLAASGPPVRIADAVGYAQARRTQAAWLAAAHSEDQTQLLSAHAPTATSSDVRGLAGGDGGGGGGSSSSSSGGGSGVRGEALLALPARRSERIITARTPRLYRYDALPAGVSLVLWDAAVAPAALARAWADIADGALSQGSLAAWRTLAGLVHPGAGDARRPGGQAETTGGGEAAGGTGSPVAADHEGAAAEEAGGAEEEAGPQGEEGAPSGASPQRRTSGAKRRRLDAGGAAAATGARLSVHAGSLAALRASLGLAAAAPHGAAAAAPQAASLAYPLSPSESLALLQLSLGQARRTAAMTASASTTEGGPPQAGSAPQAGAERASASMAGASPAAASTAAPGGFASVDFVHLSRLNEALAPGDGGRPAAALSMDRQRDVHVARPRGRAAAAAPLAAAFSS